MANAKESIISQLVSIFFPQHCAHCRGYGEELCPGCRGQLKPIGPKRCRRCGKPSLYDVPDCPECRGRPLHYHSAAAAYRFEGPARSAVHRLKYSRRRRLSGLMAELTGQNPGLTEITRGTTLTYVPAHGSKSFSRGYNQAELYARALSRQLKLPLAGLLIKKFPTIPQNRLNFFERGKNLSNSFDMKRGADCETGRVVLIDDVYTTGATASECARVLRGNMGVDVDVWTFARTVKD